jgi:hypothetical protein
LSNKEHRTPEIIIVKAKIIENSKEDPASEPDQDPNTWFIEAKLGEDMSPHGFDDIGEGRFRGVASAT